MKKKVLIVDDREENLVVLKNFFAFFGKQDDLEIFLADNSNDAYALVKENNPRLIFMDIQIENPDSGLELAKKIRADFPEADTSIWAMTAKTLREKNGDESMENQCYHSGCNKYFTKPYDQRKMILEASKVLDIEIPEFTKKQMGL